MIDFTAIATFSDGNTQDVTANCVPTAELSKVGSSTLSVRYGYIAGGGLAVLFPVW